MATQNNFKYVSPGLYRSSTGQLVNRNQLPKPTTTTTTTTGQNGSTTGTTPTTYSTTLKNAGNGYYRGADGKLVAGSAIDAYSKRFNKAASDFRNMKQEDANYNATAEHLKRIGSRYGFDYQNVLGKDWKPYVAPTPAAPDTSTPAAPAGPTEETPVSAAPATPAPQFSYQQSPMTAALMEAMKGGLNTMQAYEPKFFEGSPMYQFQKQKGSQDLEKLMSARGLTGSGAEIQANSDFLANINATESEKQRQYADQAAQRQQQAMQFVANFDKEERDAQLAQWNKNTDRQVNMQEFDAGRQDSRNRAMQDFLTNILNIQSNNNIASLSSSGLNSQTALSEALGKMISQSMANNYQRSYGGGGGTPPIAPTSGNLDLAKIMTGYGNRAGNNDVLDGFLRTIFGK